MFRYERPQKGRFRQFHQIDVELIGVAQPQADIEVIALGSRISRRARHRRPGRARAQHARRSREPRRLSRRAGRLFLGAHLRAVGGQPSPARTQSAAHSRFQRRGTIRRSVADAPVFRRLSERTSNDFFATGARWARPARHRLSAEPTAGARPRLLHPHRLRVRHDRSRLARHGAGRGAL